MVDDGGRDELDPGIVVVAGPAPLRPESARLEERHLHGEEEVFAGDRVVVLGLGHRGEGSTGTLREHGGGVAGKSGRSRATRAGVGVVSPVSAGVVRGVVRGGKSMRQLEEAVLQVLVEAERNGECPGVAEISGRAGIWSGKGDTSKGEPGSMTHSIAWGIVLKLFRAGLIRKCPKSPGRSGYEPTEQAVDRMRDGVESG